MHAYIYEYMMKFLMLTFFNEKLSISTSYVISLCFFDIYKIYII